jgi:hypothetical protein
VIASSELPEFIEIDSSVGAQKVTLSVNKNKVGTAKLNSNSKWVWYLPNSPQNYDSEGLPINSTILETGTNSITFKAKKTMRIALKAYGECETNKNYTVTVPRRLNTYYFFSIGGSSNKSENLSSTVITAGSHRVYFRFKNSDDSLFNSNYKLYSLKGVGNNISNFPTNSGLSYAFNKQKIITKTSLTMGFFLNPNKFKIYLGGGVVSMDYFKGIDLTSKNSSNITQTWVKLTPDKRATSAEFEAGFSLSIKPVFIMFGGSFITGNSYTPGYFKSDLNIGILL